MVRSIFGGVPPPHTAALVLTSRKVKENILKGPGTEPNNNVSFCLFARKLFRRRFFPDCVVLKN